MFLNYTEWTYPLRQYWNLLHTIFTSRVSGRTEASWISVSFYDTANKRIKCLIEPNPYRLTLKHSVPWTWKMKYGTSVHCNHLLTQCNNNTQYYNKDIHSSSCVFCCVHDCRVRKCRWCKFECHCSPKSAPSWSYAMS